MDNNKTSRNILIAFLLNLAFSAFEFVGGIITGSIAITSDAIHDLGDALSIGISYFLERISKRKRNNTYTYGYVRYSVLGAIITNFILVIGSVIVIYSAINRIINPIELNYNGMIIFAIFGFIINLVASYFTKDNHSLNGKAVNLHMLEDVLGWLIVLIGSIIIKFTSVNLLDALMSILVSAFILYHALKSFKTILDLFLDKLPSSINIEEIKKNLLKIKGIKDIHHIHIWSLDGITFMSTLHIVTDTKNDSLIKEEVRKKLNEYNINHVTIEIDKMIDNCKDMECVIDKNK